MVSLSITEDVPLKDVFIEIGRLADLDIEIDPQIDAHIIMRVKDQALDEVVRRIAALAGLRYKLEKGVLRVERDLPYVEHYHVDFLNLSRETSSSISSSMSIGGGGGSGGSSVSNSNGSNATISTSFTSNLWNEVELSISTILTGGISGGGTQTQTKAPTTNTGEQDISYYTSNRAAGVITVNANEHQHRSIAKYLNYVKDTVSAQVLIEAKIVEVQLSEDYYSGINWSAISKQAGNLGNFTSLNQTNSNASAFSLGLIRPNGVSGSPGAGSYGSPAAQDLQAMVQLAANFGNTTTLASPRVQAMNNQQAILSFVTNEVYFTLTVQPGQATATPASSTQTSASLVTTPTVNSTANTIPVGITLNIVPSINLETQEIMMNVRPTLTKISKNIPDPALAYLIAAQGIKVPVTSTIPEVEVREMDSVVKVLSGDIMVIGGMIDQQSKNSDSGVPGLSKIPGFGNLFKQVTKEMQVTETVIFIRATIVNSGTTKHDRDFYNDLTNDPNPVEFEGPPIF